METQVEQARRRAAQVRADTPLDVLARADALKASIADLLSRTYCGPATKGRQKFYVEPR
jgi:hypothetical protein